MSSIKCLHILHWFSVALVHANILYKKNIKYCSIEEKFVPAVIPSNRIGRATSTIHKFVQIGKKADVPATREIKIGIGVILPYVGPTSSFQPMFI